MGTTAKLAVYHTLAAKLYDELHYAPQSDTLDQQKLPETPPTYHSITTDSTTTTTRLYYYSLLKWLHKTSMHTAKLLVQMYANQLPQHHVCYAHSAQPPVAKCSHIDSQATIMLHLLSCPSPKAQYNDVICASTQPCLTSNLSQGYSTTTKACPVQHL